VIQVLTDKGSQLTFVTLITIAQSLTLNFYAVRSSAVQDMLEMN
jgi:hypothetical protein